MYFVLAYPISESRIWSISEASAALDCASFAPWLRPLTVRSRARLTRLEDALSVSSNVPSQPKPSSALREYCWFARVSPRSCIEDTVPVGESDGRLICLPLDSCSWIFSPFAMLRWRLLSTRVWMLPSVTLPPIAMSLLPSDQAGTVDQLVEHR